MAIKKHNVIMNTFAVLLAILVLLPVNVMADNGSTDSVGFRDTYNFTFSYTEYSLRIKSGHASTVCYVDLQNGILVVVDESEGRKSSHLYVTPYRLFVDEGDKIYIYEDDGTLPGNYMKIEDDICVYYNEQGEIVDNYGVHFFDDPLPARLKKVGFFNEYPTPSSFLGSLANEDNSTEDKSDVDVANTVKLNSAKDDDFILNSNSYTFHKPSCALLSTVDQNSLQRVEWSREEVIEAGYRPCKRCNP